MTAAGAVTVLRPVDRFLVVLIGALLPAGFRERQRGEWTSDLMSMAAAQRGRYLFGAARTLPALWSAARGSGMAPVAVRIGHRETIARMLMLGLTWPVVSWLLWVPARYYAFDIPGRLRRSDYTILIDPQSVWPFDHTPGWLLPLWLIPHFGAWAMMFGAPGLLFSVAVVGSLTAIVRQKRHPVELGTVTITATVAIVLGLVTFAGNRWMIAVAAAGIGLLAIVLGAISPRLGRRARFAVILLGALCLAIQAFDYTPAGQSMLSWFFD